MQLPPGALIAPGLRTPFALNFACNEPARRTGGCAQFAYDTLIKTTILRPKQYKRFTGQKMGAGAIRTSLAFKSAQPLYRQIERNIVQCLSSGEWKPGAQLPTESELAKRFGVAIYT